MLRAHNHSNPIPMRVAAFLAGLLAAPTSSWAQHVGDIRVGATAGGMLGAAYDFDPAVELFQGFCAGGLCLYGSTDPGFVALETAADAVVPAVSGTKIAMEIVSIDAGASVKVGSRVLDAAAESASLGQTPSLHVHPSWQVTAPAQASGMYTVRFRLVDEDGDYELVLAINTAQTTTTTSSSTTSSSTTSTTTSTTVAFCGDGFVDAGEECDEGRPWTPGASCLDDCTPATCGDPDESGRVSATDALFALRAAVGLEDCAACVCSPDGTTNITAGDALRVLRYAVGEPDQTLACLPCAVL